LKRESSKLYNSFFVDDYLSAAICWQSRWLVISEQRLSTMTLNCRRMTSPSHRRHCRLQRHCYPV